MSKNVKIAFNFLLDVDFRFIRDMADPLQIGSPTRYQTASLVIQ